MLILRVLPFMLISLWSADLLARQPDQGHGVVRMNGSILDTPCAIDMADRDQMVGIGIETTGELLHDGHGPVRPFSIHLINCSLQPAKSGGSRFQVTFDGKPDDGLFGVGGAAGVGLEITDMGGHTAIPGQPMPAGALVPGRMELDYVLRLVSDHARLRAGDYRIAIRFKIDYF